VIGQAREWLAQAASVAVLTGAKVIEINPEATPFSAMVDCAFEAPAGELLPKLL
jgi:NAD-dependent SIR2 family protein deacetylase